MSINEVPTKVYLLSGNRLLREALARILRKKSNIRVVGSAPVIPTAIEQITTSRCDVLLVDSMTGDLVDLKFIGEVRQAVPGLKIVLISMEADECAFLRAVRAGVAGFVLKDASATVVAEAIRAVTEDEAVCPPRLCLSLFKYVARQCSELPTLHLQFHFELSRREQQLVPMIAQGLTNKEIATQLSLSEQTVKNHIHRILQKVGTNDRLTVAQLWHDQSLCV